MSEARRTQGILDEAPEAVLPEGDPVAAFNPIGFLQTLNDTRVALERAEKTIQRQIKQIGEMQAQLTRAKEAMIVLKWHGLLATFDPEAAEFHAAAHAKALRLKMDVDQVTRADRDMVVLSVSLPAVQRNMHLSLSQFRSVMKFRDDAHEGFVQEVARQLAEDLSRDFAAAEVNVVPLGSDAVPTDKRD